mgnify:CR=1 FL=1
MEKVSVIIATMNREEELGRCLKSVCEQTVLPMEIVIVDDGVSDPDKIRAMIPPEIRFQYHRKAPPGLSASRNLGARVALGDLLLFLDDDVVLEQRYVEEIVRVFRGDTEHKIGGVCGIIVNPMPKPRLFRCWSRFFLMNRGRQGELLPWGFYTSVSSGNEVVDVDWVPGGLSCFRREVFEQYSLSNMGQAGRHGLADLEFSWRVSRHYGLKATPFARLWHYPSSRAREDDLKRGYKQALNHCRLFEAHGRKDNKTRMSFLWAMTGLILGNLGACWFMRCSRERKARFLLAIGNIKGFAAHLLDKGRAVLPWL